MLTKIRWETADYRRIRPTLELSVVIAMVAASLLHASWHALVKSSDDQVVALAGMNLVSAAVALAVLPLVGMANSAAMWVIAGSVALHFTYKIALARLYKQSGLGQAYPLARGITPVFASAIAFVALGESPPGLAVVGLLTVCTGLVALALERGGGISPRTFGAALLAGGAVAAYSVVDAYGVRIAGDWAVFTAWLVASDSALFVAYALSTRREACLRSWGRNWRRVVASGLFGVVSFCVFMWALGRAPVGPVTALRETSVLFAVLIGIVLLRERPRRQQLSAAACVTVGVVLIALARTA